MDDLLQKIGNGATILIPAAGLVAFLGVAAYGQEPVKQSAPTSIDSRVQEENIARDFIKFVYDHREALDKVIRTNDWGWFSWVKDSSFNLLYQGKDFSYIAQLGNLDPTISDFGNFTLRYENYKVPLTPAQKKNGVFGIDTRYVAESIDGKVRAYASLDAFRDNKPNYSDVSKMTPEQRAVHQSDFLKSLNDFKSVVEQYILKDK